MPPPAIGRILTPADMAQRLDRTPVPPQPGDARGVVGALPQLRIGHRQQRVQIEWAGAAAACLVTVTAVLLQAALTLPLVWRRRQPSMTFLVVATVALVQWAISAALLRG